MHGSEASGLVALLLVVDPDGLPRAAGVGGLYLTAWLTAAFSGLALLWALAAWGRSQLVRMSRLEQMFPVGIILAAGCFSFLALPHSEYRYEGEDVAYGEAIAHGMERPLLSADPLSPGLVSKMGRLH